MQKEKRVPRIGVLAVQGAFAEHIAALKQLGVKALPVRLPEELEDLDGLIIPGGESTSISKMMRDYHLTARIKELAKTGLPVFGTCAGMIMLADDILDSELEPLGLMHISVRRNAFGRQKESFITELAIPALGEKPFPAIFIRAPKIERVQNGVETLVSLDNTNGVAVREGNLLALSFHPELSDDLRFHQYFVDLVTENKTGMVL